MPCGWRVSPEFRRTRSLRQRRKRRSSLQPAFGILPGFPVVPAVRPVPAYAANDHMAITVVTPDLNFPITLAPPGPKEPRYTVRQEI